MEFEAVRRYRYLLLTADKPSLTALHVQELSGMDSCARAGVRDRLT